MLTLMLNAGAAVVCVGIALAISFWAGKGAGK